MRGALTLLLAGTLSVFSVSAGAQPVTESLGDHGTVDWSSQVIRAKGIAVPGGAGGRAGLIRAAELDALRQILETVKGMRLSSETLVENYMLSNDVIRTRVEGVVRNFRRVGDPVYMSDGSIEVTVEMNLRGTGQLFDVLMPTPVGAAPYPVSPQAPAGNYTGLLVDARGLGLRPAIAPRILSDNGEVVYGSKIVDRTWAVEQGMVGYARDPDAARGDERIAPNPMFIKAVRATGANRTDIVISDQDAGKLNNDGQTPRWLRECRVIVLVD